MTIGYVPTSARVAPLTCASPVSCDRLASPKNGSGVEVMAKTVLRWQSGNCVTPKDRFAGYTVTPGSMSKLDGGEVRVSERTSQTIVAVNVLVTVGTIG